MVGEVELLGERIAEQAAHLDAATHRLLADLREFDARGGWRAQGASSCAHWLAWRVGWDLVTARQKVLVARRLGEFPTTDEALRRGELSYSKVRAVLRVATPANEAMLLDIARLSTASQLENLSRKYDTVKAHDKDVRPRDDEQRRYVRKRDTADGMVKIEAVLHPEEAELVWNMLDHAAKQLVRAPVPPASADSGTAADPTNDAGSAWSPARTAHDSAESDVTTDLTADAESGGTRPVGDSAESTAALRVTADAKATRPAERLTHDSAESEAVAKPARGATHLIDDSVESDAVSGVPVVASAGPVATAPADDSAEAAPAAPATVGERSAGGAKHPEAHSASVPAPAEGSARPSSVLQQAERAARRAFSRADALLVVAQTYLRGDRPLCRAQHNGRNPEHSVMPSNGSKLSRSWNSAGRRVGIMRAPTGCPTRYRLAK